MRAKGWMGRSLHREEGATLVETAVAFSLMILMLFGMVEISFGLYTYHYLSEAAREVTRYAIVRGSNSCTTSNNALANCNLGPGTGGNPLQAYAQTLGYPGIDSSKMTVTPTWWSVSTNVNSPFNRQWVTQCTSGTTCNDPGNMVKVVIYYQFPLSIPYWNATTLTMTSTSSMVISN